MVKLSPELIEQCASYTNPVKDREIDFRGYKIPVIENLGATLDQFDTMDLSDNEIRKLDGFPYLKRLKNILISNNKVIRIGENLEESIPNIESIILTNNNMQELGDLDVLATLPNLECLRYLHIFVQRKYLCLYKVPSLLLGNPVTTKLHYRQYVINKLPQLRILDFAKIKEKERKQAKSLFKGKKGAELATNIGKRSKTFVPGAGLDVKKPSSKQDREREEAIRKAISSAKTLGEVERLQAMLAVNQVPGLTNGKGTDTVEEMDE
ncbi:U2 small nuclear ribonucleoprotein A'-like isoform X1 [Watersipora subatra]|uniref:U2 small nuclear ribonucleoprotein A'-like isoform X1 n=1 Tax=Watersipora subatra TaxID=2589382 RepID=UPI00355C9721